MGERLVKTDAEIRVGDFLLIIGHLSKQGVRRYMGVNTQHQFKSKPEQRLGVQ
jgi:hypothetical protein